MQQLVVETRPILSGTPLVLKGPHGANGAAHVATLSLQRLLAAGPEFSSVARAKISFAISALSAGGAGYAGAIGKALYVRVEPHEVRLTRGGGTLRRTM